MGMDYWRTPTIPYYGLGGNNHEAGASNWYSPRRSGRKRCSQISEAHNSKNHVPTAAPGTLCSIEVRFISTPANLRSFAPLTAEGGCPHVRSSPSVFAHSLLE